MNLNLSFGLMAWRLTAASILQVHNVDFSIAPCICACVQGTVGLKMLTLPDSSHQTVTCLLTTSSPEGGTL